MLRIYRVLFALVLSFCQSAPLVHSQDDDPRGFLSIDCGLPEGIKYRDDATGLYFKSDAKMIDSGESKNTSQSDPRKYFHNVRSFPQGKKNCYTIQPSPGKGNRYLIRASFFYGNYDSSDQPPTFDLNLGRDTWSTITFDDDVSAVREEIIHVLSSDYIHVCLVNTDTGTPFISALELRPLPLNSSNPIYEIDSGSLQTISRVDLGSDAVTRYPDDIYDRRWENRNVTNTVNNTSLDTDGAYYLVPMDVLRTANTPDSISDSLSFYSDVGSTSDQIYIYMHFAETENLPVNQYREFNIRINGKWWNKYVVEPKYLIATSYQSDRPETGSTRYTVVIEKTERSTLPPIINGYEFYRAKKFSNSGTNETDVDAISKIKSAYGVIKDSWQGDPCEPQEFHWDGVECTYFNSDHSDRIKSLTLSSSGLTGEIVLSIVNLTQLETLDLSDNNLSGKIPGFLSQLAFLRTLNLKGNNFVGPVPSQLLENQKKGKLSLSVDDIQGKRKMSTPIVVGAVVGTVLLLAAILFGIWVLRRRVMQEAKKLDKQPQGNISAIERKDTRYTYSKVVDITRNFRNKLGEGGFGTVYHGYLGDTQVAVKMLSPSSAQGYIEFQTEVSLLMKIHHKNLTSLVGYCYEGTHMGIIYEYMANGNLDKYLSGNRKGMSSWEIRLKIALDAAQGLEYLHHGCKPAIIHRDVKTTNILLNEQLQAKLADFGLSKAYPAEGGTHISTNVAGTSGYIDPDYNSSNRRLTEKSDVYSFGVVLLVMITGRLPKSVSDDRIHISQWVESSVRNGHITKVVDPRIGGKYDVNSVWKAVELALLCTSRNSSTRPTMNMVVIDLKESLALEIGSHDADRNVVNETFSIDPEILSVPRSR